MSSQKISRSSSRAESVEMTDKSEIQNENVPQNRQENRTTGTADVKSKHKQNADAKDKSKKCKGHKKRHGPGFMHHQPHFYGSTMFGPMGGQYYPGQTEDYGDEATDEYEQFYDNDYEESGPSPHDDNNEGAVGGEYAGPGPWHRFQGMEPMGEHGPNMMRGWWRRMMGEQNTMPQGMFGPMPGAMNFPGFRGPMGMNRRGRRHGPHHHHDEEETAPEMNDESCTDVPPEGAMNTTDSSSSCDEDIEIISPECCKKETQNEDVKAPEENTEECQGRRRGPRGGSRRGPMGRCRRRVMRQCFAMGMLHPFMMKTWLADEDTSDSDEQGEKSQHKEESDKPCKKMGKHFRRAMKYRMRMGMFHPFMLKPWILRDSSSEEDSDVPREGDSEPQKAKKWQKQRKCRRHAMRECMAMGMLPPGVAKPWMFRESSDSESTSSDSATEDSDTECKGKKRCFRKGRRGPRKMWRRLLRKQIRMNAMAGQMDPMRGPMGPRRCMMTGMGPMRGPMGQRRCMMTGMGLRYGLGPRHGYGPMNGMHRMGPMRGMGPGYGFGLMAGMHRMGPMRGMCPRQGFDPMGSMNRNHPEEEMGPGYGFRSMAGMHRMGPMRGMGLRHGFGPKGGMHKHHPEEEMGPGCGFGPMAGMHRMGPMRGMGPRHGFGPMGGMHKHHQEEEMGPGCGFGPMAGMHRMGPMRGMGPRHGFGPMGGMHKHHQEEEMGPGCGFGPMAGMQRRCPMRGMGPRHGYGPMNSMGPGSMMNPWMSSFGMMRPKKFMKIMKKIHKENRKSEKESMQKDMNSLSKDFEEGMNMTENKEQNKL